MAKILSDCLNALVNPRVSAGRATGFVFSLVFQARENSICLADSWERGVVHSPSSPRPATNRSLCSSARDSSLGVNDPSDNKKLNQ